MSTRASVRRTTGTLAAMSATSHAKLRYQACLRHEAHRHRSPDRLSTSREGKPFVSASTNESMAKSCARNATLRIGLLSA